MKTIRLAALLLATLLLAPLLAPWPAVAQTRVVANCGTLPSPLPTGSTGQPLYVDTTGKLCTNAASSSVPSSSSAAALTSNTCGSAASSCVLKASPGNFYGVYAECTAACWLMVFNSTAAPVNGATTAGNASGNLVECVDVAAASSKSISYLTFPRAFSVGITVAINSTACATLTLSTVGFISGSVM